MSQYSSFKSHQLITENWRKYLQEAEEQPRDDDDPEWDQALANVMRLAPGTPALGESQEDDPAPEDASSEGLWAKFERFLLTAEDRAKTGTEQAMARTAEFAKLVAGLGDPQKGAQRLRKLAVAALAGAISAAAVLTVKDAYDARQAGASWEEVWSGGGTSSSDGRSDPESDEFDAGRIPR